MINEWRKVIWLLNRGYDYVCIARIFDCSEEEIKRCEEELRGKGFPIDDIPRDKNPFIRSRKERVLKPQNYYLTDAPKEIRNLTNSLAKEEDIVEFLAEKLGFLKEGIEAHTRSVEIVIARDSIVYLLREYGNLSYPMIGRLINRDHTTVIHSYKKTKRNFEKDPIKKEEFPAELIDKVKTIKKNGLKMAIRTFRPMRDLEINTESGVGTNSLVYLGGEEKINHGKSSYKKYLEEYKKEIKEVREARMLQAKQTIEDLRKWRKKNGMKELDHVKINWSLVKDS